MTVITLVGTVITVRKVPTVAMTVPTVHFFLHVDNILAGRDGLNKF